ncbi:MAG: hypothetical protein ACE5L6_02030 [Candidatus Bathyarchaeia archaeon]
MAVKLKVYTKGIALQEIKPGEQGVCYFPEHGEVDVIATTLISQYQEVMVVSGKREVAPAYPEVTWPTHQKSDYAAIAYGATEVKYIIGTNAYAADSRVAWGETFTARICWLQPTTNCLVRFNGDSRVQHLLLANQLYPFEEVSVSEIYVAQQAVPGILYVHCWG